MYLIDTNIFLEILLGREKKEECEHFLEEVESGNIQAITTTFALHTIAIILEKLKTLEEYKKFLKILSNFEGLMAYSTTPEDEIEICNIARKFNLKFDDALHYWVAKSFDLTLVSFDKDFDKTDLKRVEPKDIKRGKLKRNGNVG